MLRSVVSAVLTLFSLYGIADQGFFPAMSPKIPKPVQSQVDRIFQLWVFSLVDYPVKPGEVEKAYGNAENTVMLSVVKRQYRVCEKSKKACRVHRLVGAATAFVARDARTLWTALHCFKSGDNGYVADYAGLRTPPFVLVDRHGEVVFDSLNTDSAPRFLRDEKHAKGDVGHSVYDFAPVDLGREIGRGYIPLAPDSKVAGNVFIVGFPAATTDRGVGRDAHNGELMAVFGNSVGVEQCEREYSADELRELRQALFFLSSDAAHGLSGAPALDENGRVVGMATRGWCMDPKSGRAHNAVAIRVERMTAP